MSQPPGLPPPVSRQSKPLCSPSTSPSLSTPHCAAAPASYGLPPAHQVNATATTTMSYGNNTAVQCNATYEYNFNSNNVAQPYQPSPCPQAEAQFQQPVHAPPPLPQPHSTALPMTPSASSTESHTPPPVVNRSSKPSLTSSDSYSGSSSQSYSSSESVGDEQVAPTTQPQCGPTSSSPSSSPTVSRASSCSTSSTTTTNTPTKSSSFSGKMTGLVMATGSSLWAAKKTKEKLRDKSQRITSSSRLIEFPLARIASSLCDLIYLQGIPAILEAAADVGCVNMLDLNLTEEEGAYTTNYGIFNNPNRQTPAVMTQLYQVLHVSTNENAVFRGSQNLNDWTVNFSAVKTAFHGIVNLHEEYSVRTDICVSDDPILLLQLAYQFLEEISFKQPKANCILRVLKDFLLHPDNQDEVDSYKVIFTGHSLGGALASCLYLVYSRERSIDTFLKRSPLTLFTFGAPMIVHTHAAREEAIRTLQEFADIQSMHHWVNGSDVVPRVLGGKYHAEAFKVLGIRNDMSETKNYHPVGNFYAFVNQKDKHLVAKAMCRIDPSALDDVLDLSVGLLGMKKAIDDHSMTLYKEHLYAIP